MKLAVMQPYLFPYIGYFQLIHASDLFLIYDDVAYIKQGYINRNTILSSNGPIRFTLPVPRASSNKLISELKFSNKVSKCIRTIEQSYSKAPYFNEVFPIVCKVIEAKERSIASMCQRSYEEIFSYLGLERQFKKASEVEYNRSLNAVERLISLCHTFGADQYLNAIGGRRLYSKADFSNNGIKLSFVEPLQLDCTNSTTKLSIIDTLMNYSPRFVLKQLNCFKLS